ncbi:MAG: transcription termination factor Rho [Fimbriimonadia bacterium]
MQDPHLQMSSDLENAPSINFRTLSEKSDEELLEQARSLELDLDFRGRADLIHKLLIELNREHGTAYAEGILELLPDGFGFLRRSNFANSPNDVYVSQSQIKRFGLRTGDTVFGQVRPPKDGEKYFGLLRVESVNGLDIESQRQRRDFEDLTPVYPNEQMVMEIGTDQMSARIIDLISPIGKGQRGLIVAPPKAGKTMLLKAIANSIAINNPEVFLMVLLVDERPEEVTDMRRSVRGQVISSTFDEPAENHMRVADLTLEQAKRLVEAGRDVVILLDSLTRLSRASNLTITASGRTLSGGLDPSALYRPRRFFGAARNIEEGGSMTVIATVLVDTGSRMDDAIFEEFKGTGNMELVLDRELAERRIWPAIDVRRSSTRHEELLIKPEKLKSVWQLRKLLANQQDSIEATQMFIKLLARTKSNEEFLADVVEKTSKLQ